MTHTTPWAASEAAKRKDRILGALYRMTQLAGQIDAEQADWPEIGELGHIAQQLEQVEAFWSQSGPEYS